MTSCGLPTKSAPRPASVAPPAPVADLRPPPPTRAGASASAANSAELDEADLRPGAVLVNRVRPPRLPERLLTPAADGRVDAEKIRSGLVSAGLDLPDSTIDALVSETIEHAIGIAAEQRSAEQLAEADLPTLRLTDLSGGVDVAGLYELADSLVEQGVRL